MVDGSGLPLPRRTGGPLSGRGDGGTIATGCRPWPSEAPLTTSGSSVGPTTGCRSGSNASMNPRRQPMRRSRWRSTSTQQPPPSTSIQSCWLGLSPLAPSGSSPPATRMRLGDPGTNHGSHRALAGEGRSSGLPTPLSSSTGLGSGSPACRKAARCRAGEIGAEAPPGRLGRARRGPRPSRRPSSVARRAACDRHQHRSP